MISEEDDFGRTNFALGEGLIEDLLLLLSQLCLFERLRRHLRWHVNTITACLIQDSARQQEGGKNGFLRPNYYA